jgi:hypothetical protein
MERTTLSRNLKPLVQQGYISITASSTDGRIMEISITSTGRAKFKQALKIWRGAQSRIINAYGETSWHTWLVAGICGVSAELGTIRSRSPGGNRQIWLWAIGPRPRPFLQTTSRYP